MRSVRELTMTLPAPSRRLAGAWFVLALAALGASALLAVVLVAARTPFLGLGGGLFRTALVLHVDMAVLVWFLAAAAGLWVLARGHADRFGWGAFWLAAGAVVLLLVSPLTSVAQPVLANYAPVLDSTLFIGALAAFFVAVIVTAGWSLSGGWSRGQAVWMMAARWSVLVMLATALVFALDRFSGPATTVQPQLSFDAQAWGAGHLLQFVHAVLMIGVWSVLGERLLGGAPKLARILPVLLAVAALPAVAGVLISLVHEVGGSEHRQGFTDLMRWASWPAAALFGIGLLVAAARMWRAGDPLTGEERVLLLSVLLFLAGCLVGATIHGNASTAVPAHYHGTVGAVTLAYLLLARRLALSFDLRLPNDLWVGRLPFVYGIGTTVLVAGLTWSGFLGVPRKAPHVELAQMDGRYLTAMGLAGVGGFVALSALAVFVAVLLQAAWRAGSDSARDARGEDVRWRLVVAVLGVLGGGFFLFGAKVDWFLSESTKTSMHVAEKRRIEVDQRFKQGVVMLHAKQYDHALTSFHRVLELAPEMPEAYVNTGFALLGKGDFAAAADSFDEATTLRRDQVNAYYGLAVALEGMGNMRGAMEAMRAYLHRAPANDPYRVKAEAAVWEWGEARRLADEEKADAAGEPAKR